jgi:mono/diheme cytochrome c family protein
MGLARSRFGIFMARGALVMLAASIAAARAAAQAASPSVPAPVRRIFMAHCVECHSGSSPSAGMSLEPTRLPASIVDKSSTGKPEFKIADSASPEKSYLLMKVRGAAGIAGSRMPLRANKLTDAEIQTLADWLAGLKTQAGAVEAKKI